MINGLYTWGPSYIESDVRFRLWAPKPQDVSLWLDGKTVPMQRLSGDWYEVTLPAPETQTPYGFLIDGTLRADPASRSQLSDVHGASLLHDPRKYRWMAPDWRGRPWEEAIVYEIHIGAFTQEGTFVAAIEQLDRLAGLGFTAIEIMPIAHFGGTRSWGYDGVLFYAPHRAYGMPDELKMLVDAAHARGLMVLLDVVYNHFGPDGNYIGDYAPEFFHKDRETPWGRAIDYANSNARRYFIENAVYWLEDYRLDGLRFDAVDQIEDQEPHILEEIVRIVHKTFPDRTIHLVTENPPNGTDLLTPRSDGIALFRADWNDDFHHAMHVAATGETGGYYEPYRDDPWRKVAHTLAHGYLMQGKPILDKALLPPESLPPTSYVHFLQNHDQIGNRALGDRLRESIEPRDFHLWTAILLLTPQIPLMFMGDEYQESAPFHFFSDFEGELGEALHKNRLGEADKFGGIPAGYSQDDIRNPNALATFLASKLDHGEAALRQSEQWQAFLRQLMEIRQRYIVPLLSEARGHAGTVHPAGEALIAVDWALASRRLFLRANFTAQNHVFAPASGDVIFSWPLDAGFSHDDTLEALSLRVSLE